MSVFSELDDKVLELLYSFYTNATIRIDGTRRRRNAILSYLDDSNIDIPMTVFDKFQVGDVVSCAQGVIYRVLEVNENRLELQNIYNENIEKVIVGVNIILVKVDAVKFSKYVSEEYRVKLTALYKRINYISANSLRYYVGHLYIENDTVAEMLLSHVLTEQ